MASPPARPAVDSLAPVEIAAASSDGAQELPAATDPVVALEDHLPVASTTAGTDSTASFTGVRSGVPVRREGLQVTVRLREGREIVATLDAAVEPALIDDAIAARDRVLLEAEGGPVVLIGVVATRRSRPSHIEGDSLVIEGRDEIVLKSGRAALRLRADGDVELVGSRISASSRGLFRLVGRLLRLN